MAQAGSRGFRTAPLCAKLAAVVTTLRRTAFLVLLFLLAGAALLAAQAASGTEPAVLIGPDPAPPGALRIVDISFDASGISRERALLLVSGLSEDAVFADAEELEAALLRARQDLMNRRVFDGIVVSWAPVPAPDDAAADATPGTEIPVAVHFAVDDGWTLLPIPFYRYNTNTGHNPFVVLYWDNAFGTLTDFGFSAGYYSRDWVTPFRWDVRLDWRRIRLWNRTWNVSLDQIFFTEEQASPAGEVEFAYSGYDTSFSVGTSFRLSEWLRYSLSPSLSATYGYETVVSHPDETVPSDQLNVGLSHGLSTGRTDWIGNLRRGWGAGVSQSVSLDARSGSLGMTLGASGSRHWLPLRRVSPGVRARVRHNVFENSLSQGGGIRGVADNRVFGQTLLTVNSQLSVTALDIRRVLELQVVPFVDVALARKQGRAVGGDDLFMGFGADLLLFPDFLRGFEARGSFGFDVRDLAEGRGPTLEFLVTNALQF